MAEYSGEPFFEFSRDVMRPAGEPRAHLLTEWPEYKDLDFAKIKKTMARPFILDAKSHLDGAKLEELGFHTCRSVGASCGRA